MRAMTDSPIADLTDPNTLVALENLHPAPTQPIKAIDTIDFPPAPEVDEPSVLRAVKRMNLNAAAGPEQM